MVITATELKNNLGHWLDVSADEDVFVKRKGRVVSKLSNPYRKRVDELESLVGVLPADFDAESALEERRAAL